MFNTRLLFLISLEDLDFLKITLGVQHADAFRDGSFIILPVWHLVCSLHVKVEAFLQLKETASSSATLIISFPTGSLFFASENSY